ncbi:hypothetical protein Tco_0647361 [Tanacetum coccineum]
MKRVVGWGVGASIVLQQKDASGGGCGNNDLFAVGFVSLAAGSLEEGSFSEKDILRLREVVVSLLCAPMVVTIVLPTMSMTSWGGVPAERESFCDMLRDQADHVRSCLEKLHVMICEMQRVRSLVGNDSLECLRESREIENNKLKALTYLIAQTEDAIRRKEGHVDIMKLSE